jgi:PhoPQ-activated pathogenicity-related protein
MTKSVVRAMDAIQAFSRTRDDLTNIDDFLLISMSKRGWAAWLAAAVDS